MNPLPVDSVLAPLRAALEQGANAVLQAPPGSGKTTRVPLALAHEPWLAGRRIVILEPRRLAARAAAIYMAEMLHQTVGETVGYRMRRDTKVSPQTRIEVVTEGVLTRMLQSDPLLEAVGLLVFDEFHERSLHADLGLALALHARLLVRPDLRLLVMSATLDAGPVSALLGNAPVISAHGRSFPVETRYRPVREGVPLEQAVALAVVTALNEEPGDVLVFLPGTPEIRRVAERLDHEGLGSGVALFSLYGDLSPEAQAAAIRPSPAGDRKVVLATSIAQTSLTIEGVRVVIDAGLARTSRFSPRTGMARLVTVPVSVAAADQRRGRAGRVAPGVCYRLWAEQLDAVRKAHDTPEILDADLAPLALELALAGIHDPGELRWLDPPPAATLGRARQLLEELGALDSAGRATLHGRRIAPLGVHPRLAHMLMQGAELGFGRVAADLAAILTERDPLRGVLGVDADIRTRLDALRRDDARMPGATRHRLRIESQRLRAAVGGRRAGGSEATGDIETAGMLLALAYPDRIGQRRPGASQRFLLRNGQGASFADPQTMGEADFIVAAELDGDVRESRIFLAAPVTLSDVLELYRDQVTVHQTVEWDAAA
ncbi:MAG TPA: ATP-dependent helicase HrpB, partial [Gemmatimonadales bacterium]|nr:ATP-dependent helicase HrpB [Gemmatimonadales bacterium]